MRIIACQQCIKPGHPHKPGQHWSMFFYFRVDTYFQPPNTPQIGEHFSRGRQVLGRLKIRKIVNKVASSLQEFFQKLQKRLRFCNQSRKNLID